MQLFLVGQNHNGDCDFQGVFDNYEKAIAACIAENYFIKEVTLNEEYPKETIYWDNLEYPKNK